MSANNQYFPILAANDTVLPVTDGTLYTMSMSSSYDNNRIFYIEFFSDIDALVPVTPTAGTATVLVAPMGNVWLAPTNNAITCTGVVAGATGASLTGADISALNLAALQATSGTLSITIDGVVHAAVGLLNFLNVTSFEDAAAFMATRLALTGGQTCTWDSGTSQFIFHSGTIGSQSTITECTGSTIPTTLGLSTAAGATLIQGTDISAAATYVPPTFRGRIEYGALTLAGVTGALTARAGWWSFPE
jgi:hypothetical protein